MTSFETPEHGQHSCKASIVPNAPYGSDSEAPVDSTQLLRSTQAVLHSWQRSQSAICLSFGMPDKRTHGRSLLIGSKDTVRLGNVSLKDIHIRLLSIKGGTSIPNLNPDASSPSFIPQDGTNRDKA